MRFKKILTSLFFLGALASPVLALEVDGKMPSLAGRSMNLINHTPDTVLYYYPFVDEKGEVIGEKDKHGNIISSQVEYISSVSLNKGCLERIGIKPFAIYSLNEKKIFVDPDADGVINQSFNSDDRNDLGRLYLTCRDEGNTLGVR